MKYIRTEQTIFEVIEETNLVYRVRAKNKKNIYSKSKCQTTVNGSADTIEELCDEFVQEYPQASGIGHLQTRGFNEAKSWNICDFKVYGAIWTDKGLIYVAKMNEKGELELLCQM